jgi:hypothetical protein
MSADEYEMAAEWCAARGLKGAPGDPLPNLLGSATAEEINADPEAFRERVRVYAYARAMERIERDRCPDHGCRHPCDGCSAQADYWQGVADRKGAR